MKRNVRMLLVAAPLFLTACANTPVPDGLSEVYEVNIHMVERVLGAGLPVTEQNKLTARLNELNGYHTLYVTEKLPEETYSILVDRSVKAYVAAKAIIMRNHSSFNSDLLKELEKLDSDVQTAYREYQQQASELQTEDLLNNAVRVIGLLNRYGYLVL